MPDVDLSKLFAAATGDVSRRTELMLSAVGVDIVAWLREFVEATSPPVRKGEGDRKQRRGGWADVTGRLALAYEFEVVQSGPTEFTLIVSNPVEYAEHLEAREGLFVVSGAFDTDAAALFLQKRFAETFGVDVSFTSSGTGAGSAPG